MTHVSPTERAVRITVGALATYRLARIIPQDTIAADVRRRLDRWAVTAPEETRWVRRWAVDLVTCPVCFGFWIAGAVTVMNAPPGRRRWTVATVDWVATAGLAVLMIRADPPEAVKLVGLVGEVQTGSTTHPAWAEQERPGRLPGPRPI